MKRYVGPFCPCCGTGAFGLEILVETMDEIDKIEGFKSREVQEDLLKWAKQIREKELLHWAKQIREKEGINESS